MPQYVSVRFTPNDPRLYTYIDLSGDLKIGDKGAVHDARSAKRKRVEVMAVEVQEPNFTCKEIFPLDAAELAREAEKAAAGPQ